MIQSNFSEWWAYFEKALSTILFNKIKDKNLFFIVNINLMFISIRKKQPSTQNLNQTQIINPSNDESFAQSNISKRFVRKKDNLESTRLSKRGRGVDEISILAESQGKEATKSIKLSNTSIKKDQLYLKLTHTPLKHRSSHAPASSDRATQSTYLKQRYQTQSTIFNPLHFDKKNSTEALKEQIQLKNGQIMLLEDELMRLKRQLSAKQQQFLKNNIKKEKQYQHQLSKKKDQITQLKKQIVQKNSEIKQYQKAQGVFVREVKGLKYDKLLLQKQIEQIYKKKLPKDLKDLMSFRQLSLMRQIQDLKLKVDESKTDSQLHLQHQIHKLKQEHTAKAMQLKNMQVHNRVLHRKVMQYEQELAIKADNFTKYYNNMKEANTDLLNQLKKARKQNIKLRRIHILTQPHAKKHHNCAHSSSQQSLSLSVSSNS